MGVSEGEEVGVREGKYPVQSALSCAVPNQSAEFTTFASTLDSGGIRLSAHANRSSNEHFKVLHHSSSVHNNINTMDTVNCTKAGFCFW